MTGIYKITNLINNRCYIGQSINILHRFYEHKNHNKKFDTYPLYKAFKKYGIENFSFDIIEECRKDLLNSREIYWIKFYNSNKTGYNQNEGGQGNSNIEIKISEKEMDEILDLLLYSDISQREIAKRFNVGDNTISNINQGKTRVRCDLDYPIRKRAAKNRCKDCGKIISKSAIRCESCSVLNLQQKGIQKKSERISREQLKSLIRFTPFTKIAEMYGVTDNAVRKWCDMYKLPRSAFEIRKINDNI